MIIEMKNDVTMEKSPKLNVLKKAGGSIIGYPGVYSEDSRYLFITWGNSVRSYNVETGDFVTSYEGLLKDAVGVSLHPSVSGKIVAISCEGKLVEWQCTRQVNHCFHPDRSIQLGNSKVKFEVLSFSLILLEDDNPCAVCVVKVNGCNYAEIKTFCVITGIEKKFVHGVRADNSNRSLSMRQNNGETLMAVFCNKPSPSVTFLIKCGSEIKRRYVQTSSRTTCVACHPSELCVLTGDKKGRIKVWRNLLGKPVFSQYHWHTLPVEALAFSVSGTYFYSGGGECVLVKWILDSPQDRWYIPRLPAEIAWLSVSPDNLCLAISTRDNGIQLIDSTTYIVATIQHFSWSVLPSYKKTDYLLPSEMSFDPRTKSLVINARSGHIQFFSVDQGNLLFLMDIVAQNYLSQERSVTIYNTDVVKFSFNADGWWLATVELRGSRDNTPNEIRLKFWEFDKVKQRYTLNTSVENPHRGKIFSVRFQPSTNNQGLMCITTGEDKKFRTWILQKIPFDHTKTQGEYQWLIQNVGYYRNLCVREVGFSVDGSLMAVTFGPTLTVWVPGINQIKCSLTPPDANEDLTHVSFGQKSVHLIVTGSKAGLAVWNLLTLSLLWIVPFNLRNLVSDPESDVLAAFSMTNDVVIFTPNSHEPIFIQNSLIRLEDSEIVNAIFIPYTSDKSRGVSWQSNSQLYFFNSKQELFYLQDPRQESYTLEGQNLDVMPTPYQSRTAYGLLVAKESRSDVVSKENKHYQQFGVPGRNSLNEFLEMPAHTMPPLTVLSYSLLLSFIAGKKAKSDFVRSSKIPEKENKIDDSDHSEDETQNEAISPEPTFEKRKETVMKIQKSSGVSPSVDVEKRLEKISHHSFDWVSHLST